MPFSLINEKIDFSKSEQYTLSIRLSTDGFSFSVYNPIDNSSYCFPLRPVNTLLSMAVNLKQILKETEFLNYSYKRVNILMVSKRYTLVPLEFFDDEQAEDVFYYNISRQENEIILYNVLHKAAMSVVFSMDQSVHSLLAERFPQARFYSQTSPLIEHFTMKSRMGNNNKMYVHLCEDSLDIFCFERGRLLFGNTFSGKETSDRTYYLLYIWKTLNFDQERDELHLAGWMGDKEQLVEELGKYIRQLFIVHPKAEFNNPENVRFEEMPFDLQALAQCEINPA